MNLDVDSKNKNNLITTLLEKKFKYLFLYRKEISIFK